MSYGGVTVNSDTTTCLESVPRVFATLFNNGIDDAGDVVLQVYSGDSIIATKTWHDVAAGTNVNLIRRCR